VPIGWQSAAKLRFAALTLGSAAAGAMVVVGCSTVIGGTAQVDTGDAPVYRASVSASIEESLSSSVARESERQQALTTKAVHTVCEDLSTSSVDAFAAVNAFVEAVNQKSPDVPAKIGPAVDALNRSADLVSSGITDVLSPQLHAVLTEWVDAARGVAATLSGNLGQDQFNSAVNRLNTSRDVAVDRCDAEY
jgi:hypothetical protein